MRHDVSCVFVLSVGFVSSGDGVCLSHCPAAVGSAVGLAAGSEVGSAAGSEVGSAAAAAPKTSSGATRRARAPDGPNRVYAIAAA